MRTITWSLVGLAVGITALLGITQGSFNFRLIGLVSNSMAPTCPIGSLLLLHRVPANAYQVGDIVTFRSPTSSLDTITHRIVSVRQDQSLLLVVTKGDANSNGDPWSIPAGSLWGKSVFCIPLLGAGSLLLGSFAGFLSVALLVTSLLLWVLLKHSNSNLRS